MRGFIVIILVVVGGYCYGQPQMPVSTKSKKAEELYKSALEQLGLLYYDRAIYYLNEALKHDSNFIDAFFLLGQIYTDIQDDSLAIEFYKKGIVLNPDYYPPVYSEMATIEFNIGRYSDALEHIKKYLSYTSKNPRFREAAELLQKNCEFASVAVKNPVPFNPANVGPSINNKYDQYWPSLSADEQTFVFTQALPIDPNNPRVSRNRQEDFYISYFRDDSWTPSKPVGAPLNTLNNEGAQTISADGRIMVFTGCNRKDGYGNCDLYIAYQENGEWTVPKNMGTPVNSNAKETQPSISADGKIIYYASNREGTKGGLDLWMTQINDSGKWCEPVNLGDSINTRLDEQSPFIHPDNKTMYFSSKGWPGLGRFDLFISHRKSDSLWTTPRNLGYPINTYYSEEGLIVNAKGNTAYYSSDRNGFGGRDIFSFELYPNIRPTPVSYMKGRVYDADTKAPLKARFELIDLSTSITIMDASSDNNGSFLVCIPAGKDYALNVNKKGYLFYSDNFTMTKGDYQKPFIKDIPLNPLKIGNKVIMKNIFFDHDSYELRPESKVELLRLVSLMKEITTLKIEISGHTSDYGSNEYNQKLSENRAKAVAGFITSKGIDAKRVTWKGYGESQPIVANDTEEHRSQNRRTEFRVIGL
jgi:outer membrane protein OmpA-like peptidoglycan-associated protein/tetratricopeptide (TPR) repeat protein